MSKPLQVDFSITSTEASIDLDGQVVTWTTEATHPFSATTGNFALLAALPAAFTQKRPLHVLGEIDRALLRNAVLLSHFWAQWKPEMYGPIEITAKSIVDGSPSKGGHVICLSGGVDSTFALLSALNEKPSLRLDVDLGVFVQGFDYGPNDKEAYNRILASIRAVAKERGVSVSSVKTNWAAQVCGAEKASWEHVHTLGLAAIMHLFGGDHAGGILGSDYTYTEDHTVAPWSSNGTTNRMIGARGFPVVPVGEHATRIDKIAAISNWGVLPHVAVCWAGPRTGKNCSRCEKCIRTMLMCEARGIDPTPAFGRRPEPLDLARISLHSAGKIAFIKQTLTSGSKLSPQLRRAAERAVAKNIMRNWLRPHYKKIIKFREPGLP